MDSNESGKEKKQPQDEVMINGVEYTRLDPCISYCSKSLCKIIFENKVASGFLIKLYKDDLDFFCLITCEHVIKRYMIKNKCKICFYYDSINAKLKEIELDENKRYIKDFRELKNIDATIIEIIPSDKISSEFFLSPNIDYMYDFNKLENKDIAIIQYPKGKLAQAYGIIKSISKNKYEFSHTASTEKGSSGSPILLKDTIEVIGIHKGGNSNNSENYAYFIWPIFDFFKNFSKITEGLDANIYDVKEISNRNENIKGIKHNINNNNLFRKVDNSSLNKQSNYQLNKLTILYEVKGNSIKIFGEDFVKNNKQNCYLLINGERRELCNKLYLKEINIEKDILKIILIETNFIINMSSMFHYGLIENSSLISLPDISEWNTSNVNDMRCMLYNCSSLKSLPDISKWNTTNVKDMSYMFYGCSSLSSLPDISKWNTTNVTDMSGMFSNYSSLDSLPDISKSEIEKFKSTFGLFVNYNLLKSLPGISHLNEKIGNYMSNNYFRFSSLVSLPDISKWNTTNVKDMSYMFYNCKSLVSLPDISKWNTINVTNMTYMFYNCSSLSSLPDISKWNTTNIKDMRGMFSNCSLLKSLPNIGKWNISNVKDMSHMFYFCNSLESLPDISNWKFDKELNKYHMFEGCNKDIIPEKFKESNCIIY